MALRLGVRCGSSGGKWRYRQNWFILTTYCTLLGFAFSSALPSLHQFVTSSTRPEDPNVQPGLGLSETWYSWIVGVVSIGELAGAVGVSLLLRWLYTKHLMLSTLAICAIGGVLFGIGRYGWMLLIGRLLIGCYIGGMTVIIRTYIGETSSTVIANMPPAERERSTLKYTAFFVTFTVCTISLLSGSAIAAIVAQIPSIDQFRWSGYFILVHAVILAVGTLVGFREKADDIQKKRGSINCRDIPIPLYTVVLLVAAFFAIGWYFAVFESLLNPVLADNFGFDVEYDSYAFIGTLMFFSIGLFVLYAFQRLHVDNRITCFVGLLLALCGSLVATDWQSLGGDPCDQFSKITNFSESESHNTTVGSGSSQLESTLCDVEPGGYRCTAEKFGINLEQCEEDDVTMTIANASCVCEAFSDVPGYNCFWNPHSRVTGRECPRCAKLCRSRNRSLNLVQFLLGISFMTLCIPIGRISLTLITSDAMAGESQALIMGVLVAMGAIGRFTGPIWANTAYLAANHRVYIVTVVLSLTMMTVLVFYLLLYRTMRPAHRTELRSSESSVVELNITSNVYASEVKGIELDHFTSVDDDNELRGDTNADVSDSLLKGERVVMEEGGGVVLDSGRRLRGRGRDGELVVLLNDIGGTEGEEDDRL